MEEVFAMLDTSGDGCIDRAEAQVFVSMLPKDEQPADEAEFNAGFDKVAGGDECVDLADAMKEFAWDECSYVYFDICKHQSWNLNLIKKYIFNQIHLLFHLPFS